MILKTKIQLRNDTAAKWKAANSLLKKGEIGIEIDTGLIKIGTGLEGDTWNNLPYINDVVSHTTTVTSEDARKALTGMVSGDVCIVKQPIAGDKYSYTCYIYDAQAATADKWVAADGNYSADNVILKENITLAGGYDKVGNVYLSEGSIKSAGMTVSDLFTKIFTKELQPNSNPTKPYVDLKINGSNGFSVEAGSTVIPKWTTDYGTGAYTYKSSASKDNISPVDGTGVKFNSWSLTKTGVSGSIGSTLSGTADNFIIEDSAVVFTMTGNHTAGNYALSNLNKLSNPIVQLASGSKSNSVTISSYRKEFAGGTSKDNTINSALIRGLSKSRATTTSELEFSAQVGDTRLIFAYPHNSHTKVSFEYFTMSWEAFPGFQKSTTTIKVADSRGGAAGLKDYDIWTYEPAGAFAAPTKFKIKFN